AHTSKLAIKLGVKCELICVENMVYYPQAPSPFKKLVDAYLKQQKATLVKIAKSFKPTCNAHFIIGEPVKEILSLLGKRNKFEMIVLGTHGLTGVNRIFLGSVAEEIIRRARIPVMVIGPKVQAPSETALEKTSLKILIPTTLGPNSLRAETYGAELAKRLNAEVILFHNMRDALPPLLQTAFANPHSIPAICDYFEETRESLLKQLRRKSEKIKKSGVNISYKLDSDTSSATESILKEVSTSGCSMLVMGTHGRSLVSGFFLGRTARDLILQSPVPVITLHSKKS
ncbi:MAG: universal stress protein, partial [Chthonomonadaceae bacterium]|nr:universal stress protein [Chthonomonadaceae bacterium]